jgi:hypothetical protein
MDQRALSNLLLCLHKDTESPNRGACLSGLQEEGWKNLVDSSGRLGVKCSLYNRLKTLNMVDTMPQEQLKELRNAYLSNAARYIIYRNEVTQIAKEFQSTGISLIILKGAFLASFVYKNPATREMSDIDLLVKTSDLAQAAKILESLGYKAERPYKIDHATLVAHHLPPFLKPGKGVVELHWNIISLVGNKPIEEAGLWEKSVRYDLTGVPISGLCQEDLLLHVCGHASYHHKFEVGLRALVDIVEITDHYNNSLNWNQFVQRALDWHWGRGVYLVLRLAKELLGAIVPEEVLADLQPADFKDYILDFARSQMLSDDPLVGTVTFPMADWHVASFGGKVSIFWQRLFLPKPLLADRFGISSDSPIIYLYYPIRFFDLLLRYFGLAIKLWRGDQSTAPFVERKGVLQDWMHKKE